MQNIINAQDKFQQARTYHQRMPDRIREYLHKRGLPDPVICRFLIGWNEHRVTIPVTNSRKEVVFFKLAKDPADASDTPTMMTSIDHAIELYGWERIIYQRDQIVICENEFERLVLEANGFAAIASTGGPQVFLPEWASALAYATHIYVCFRTDRESQDAAGGVSSLIPGSRIVQLPAEVGANGGIEDFFVRLGKTRDDFQTLLTRAFNQTDGR